MSLFKLDDNDLIRPDYTTITDVITKCTDDLINDINWDNPPPLQDIEIDLVYSVKCECNLVNQNLPKTERLRAPNTLLPRQIGDILLNYYHIKNISLAETSNECNILAVYHEYGENAGCYTEDLPFIERQIHKLSANIKSSEIKDVIRYLQIMAPITNRTIQRELVPVNNGVFNFETKRLMPFSPEYVFLTKSKVNYNPFAINPIIHNDNDGTDWDVESWMSDLSDDPEIVNLLWQFLSAVVRPYVGWRRSMIFYSTSGNNGKGCLIDLARLLVGDSAASIQLSQFNDRFTLEQIMKSSAILVDESPVGGYIDDISILKAIITGDVINTDRKYKTPVSFRFRGMTVFCWNGYVKMRDKSGSWYRRLIIVPFDKCFTGNERTYIKDDYLQRNEVLEYVLFRILNMNFYEFSVPTRCQATLDEYKQFNNAIKTFIDEFIDRFVWNFVPFSFIYELYKRWFKSTNPSGQIEGKNKFLADFKDLMNSDYKDSAFEVYDKKKRISSGDMDGFEPLIIEYNIETFQNKMYPGNDLEQLANFKRNEYYNGGIIRTELINNEI